MEKYIRRALSNYNIYQAEARICRELSSEEIDISQNEKLGLLERKIAIIDCWLSLLNEDEAFVVRKHLVEGLDWGRVYQLHEQKWGSELSRSERTLVRYQSCAIKKMMEFSNNNSAVIATIFHDM